MTLFRLSWPIFVETILFMLLGMVDVFVLSQYDDLAASAVNTAGQAVSVLTIVFTVISGACGIILNQYLGAARHKDASRIAALSILLHLIFGLVISLVLLLFSTPILRFIGAKEDILRFSSQYLSIVGGFLFFQALLNAFSVIIRSHGMTKITMIISAGMNILNTGLDVIFVLGLCGVPKMGVAGVAIATVFSRVLGCVILGIALFRRVEKPSIFRLLRPFPKKDMINIVKIGVPSALETFFYNLSQLVITSIVLNCLTNTELIAKTYIQDITMFFYLFSIAIGQGSQILIGHIVGSGNFDKAYHQGVRSHLSALLIAIPIAVAGLILHDPLIRIFTSDSQVLALGAVIFGINLFLELGRTTNLVLIACLRAAGDVYFPTMCAIFSNWLLSVLGSYLLAVVCGMGIYGLWIALALDECVRGVLMILRWKSGKWRTKSLTAAEPALD